MTTVVVQQHGSLEQLLKRFKRQSEGILKEATHREKGFESESRRRKRKDKVCTKRILNQLKKRNHIEE